MKVGDIVRRKKKNAGSGMTIQGFEPGDVGMIIAFPKGVGSVVDILAKGIKIRYWIDGLDVITHLRE
tara:strand:- start:107 stop:307 length:201 start_codon:yes stop_codon:yes gene_type:complete